MSTVTLTPGYPVTVVISERGRKDHVLERSETTAELIEGCLLRCRIMYNAAGVSGGVRWFNPATGDGIAGIAYHVEFVHPATGELVHAELS